MNPATQHSFCKRGGARSACSGGSPASPEQPRYNSPAEGNISLTSPTLQVSAALPWQHCLHWAPIAMVPILIIHVVRGLTLLVWIGSDRTCLITLTLLLSGPGQGPFPYPCRGREGGKSPHSCGKQPLSWAAAVLHLSREYGVK